MICMCESRDQELVNQDSFKDFLLTLPPPDYCTKYSPGPPPSPPPPPPPSLRPNHIIILFLVFPSRASKGGGGRGKSKQMGNQIIRKGWLSMPVSLIRGNSRDFWFVLTAESLTWYKDNDVRDFPPIVKNYFPLTLCVYNV